MKIYLASRYTRLHEMCAYRSDLLNAGHEVTSRWIDGGHQVGSKDLLGEKAPEHQRTIFALEDWEDLMRADCCVSFTEAPRSSNSRGGRHVEFGGALAAGKRCIIVGHRENVFHCLPQIEFFNSWAEALEAVGKGAA